MPEDGALLLGPTDYTGRAQLSANSEELTGGFKLATLSPAAFFEPDLRPPAEIRLSNGATIVGFRSAEPGVLPQAGSLWSADMVWRYETQPDADDTVFVHVVDGHGNNYGQQDLPGLPVGQWRSGEYALNQFHIAISPDLPASGPLFLRVGMYNDTRQAEVLDADGNPSGGYALIQIRGSEAPAASWGAGLTLDAMTVPASQPQGPPLVVQATWRVDAPLAADTRLAWRVWDAAGRDAFYSETALAPGIAPGAIPAGAFIGAQYSLRIPTDISPGIYRLSVAPLSASDGSTGQLFALPASIEITLRERQFEPPPAQHTLAASFGDVLALTGYDLALEQDTLQLVLHWRALGTINVDYKYFVHLWRDGEIVTQVDTMPAAYSYPTSWWAPHEYFSDAVQIDMSALIPGCYLLTVGVYEPETNVRLPAYLSAGIRSPDEWVALQEVELGDGS